jgi:hypothetical protein
MAASRLSSRRFAFWLGLSAVASGTAFAAASHDISLAGWRPVITMWGGDTQHAVATLERVTQALNAAIHRYEIDAPTQKFIDGVIKELEDFDLDGLYKLLPDQVGGRRELNVKGALVGNTYRITRAEPGSAYGVGMRGPRNGLADLSVYVHARQKEGVKRDTLAIGGSVGLGLGPLELRALAESQRELWRLVTTGHYLPDAAEPLPTSGVAREAVRELNPGLGDEDLDALAVLFDAFPKLGRALSQVGRVEDVRAAPGGKRYHHITTRLRAEPDRLKKKYPALAKHARKLSDVLWAKARVVDARGRDVVRATVDSKKLVATLECYVRDGLLLPFDQRRVYEDEPTNPLAEGLQRYKVLVDARVNLLGIVVEAKGLRIDAEYQAHGSYASASASMTTVPTLDVKGRALGIFSPRFLDLFIPGNIQSITEEFFQVAAQGNDGKGVYARGELGATAAGAPGAVSGSGAVEIMDTFLVKLGGGMVANRLMIDVREKEEATRLAGEVLDAFVSDFAAFNKRLRSTTAVSN